MFKVGDHVAADWRPDAGARWIRIYGTLVGFDSDTRSAHVEVVSQDNSTIHICPPRSLRRARSGRTWSIGVDAMGRPFRHGPELKRNERILVREVFSKDHGGGAS